MLTAEEKLEIDEAVQHVPERKAACIEALKVVQSHRRWISDEALKEVAEYMEMSPDALEAVSTFYNLLFRKPVGRHVILLCDSISCWVMGYKELQQHLAQKLGITLGETTADDRFTLLPNCCLGTCDRAPALMIDNDLYRNVTPAQLDGILEKYE
ncbi:MAG: NADH-quinone oxidoreductase subunit NuoE [Cyclobacteriaceae bacterium]|nr:NADH-quinone oxidoreductase subunit NuoE [Cyclobacteriaceae bacterium]MCB0500600.1 NADH-quinone oxidoreductase subunit NuoE [Cyclobacteriaceae bacterium]MCB9237445.1 NADH-quinone oxidoreductase subunit NuoE [Flammeovirgaceae bacterium]MCO5273114.1 NADH-quinone oxidoreductase subunit NuoE [Cyclobacteriaceae bacterium]MCW5903728.1 NADH-quinone oxidoreductase subunit NuoE [Cyclobacteriaceae bacterium]